MPNSRIKNNLTIVLAGGRGERLYPLTRDRAKPAVPFGGIYRIIDFTLSNCIHSDLRKIEILTQYKSFSLTRHLNLAWNKFNYEQGEYIHVIPPQLRMRKTWYQGTADAIYQNIYTLESSRPKTVLILSGDHIYKMDYRKMLLFHLKNNADVTIGAVVVPQSKASPFGVIEKDKNDRVIGFQEKPASPKHLPGNPDLALISMGIYIFNADLLVKRVVEDAKDKSSGHDFGKNVIPAMIKKNDRIYVYSHKGKKERFAYWRDIGTLDAFWSGNMDILENPPVFNLMTENWPILTYHPQLPPAKISNASAISQSIISNGCVINDAKVNKSVLSPGVKIGKGCEITESVIMDHVKIGSNVKIRRSIIDKRVTIPTKTIIDCKNSKRCKNTSFTYTEEGITVVPKDEPFLN